jgi:hypothetical protein
VILKVPQRNYAMSIQSHALPNDIYLLKEGISHQQLSAAINRCLCQAEALAIVATVVDAETVGLDTIDNYLWTLSSIIQEARWLYGHLMNKY